MSIAPIPPQVGFGMTPGFGINPAHGVAGTMPRTGTDILPVGGAGEAGAFGMPIPGGGTPSFGVTLANKIEELNGLQLRTDELARRAATGDLEDVHEYTVAAAESGVATQLAVAVRDRAVGAFNEIMRMQL